jgi:hypothetical protein
VFITGLRNKSQGCGASVASGAGLFTTKKNSDHIRVGFMIVNNVVNNDLGRICKQVAVAQFKVLLRNLPQGSEGYDEKY